MNDSFVNTICLEKAITTAETINSNIEIPDLDISQNIIAREISFVHCKGCKKNCAPELFTDLSGGKTFKQCSDCRRRNYGRRHPNSLLAQPDIRQTISIPCMCK